MQRIRLQTARSFEQSTTDSMQPIIANDVARDCDVHTLLVFAAEQQQIGLSLVTPGGTSICYSCLAWRANWPLVCK